MARPASSPGRLLEAFGDRRPRGMTVHDRTRLIGRLPPCCIISSREKPRHSCGGSRRDSPAVIASCSRSSSVGVLSLGRLHTLCKWTSSAPIAFVAPSLDGLQAGWENPDLGEEGRALGHRLVRGRARKRQGRDRYSIQRRAAKKQKGSANRAKARLKVARIQVRIADTRSNFLHPLASRIVRENQGIAVEGLAVCNMKKNRSLPKPLSEAGWGEFLRQLEYKAAWHGATLIGGDRGYPSSKRCHDCGHAVSALPPDVRAWVCPECGATHDCDINAARNILTAGLAGLACGETVSPVSP